MENREPGGIDPEIMAVLLHRSGDIHVFGAEEYADAPTSNQEQSGCPAAKETSRSSPRYHDVQRESTNRAAIDNVCKDMKQRELEAVARWHEGGSRCLSFATIKAPNSTWSQENESRRP